MPRCARAMSVPGPIVGTVTTSSGVPEARPAPRAGHLAMPSRQRLQPTPGQPAMTSVEPSLNVVQGALEGLNRPLAETEFVVVDLETTGGSPADAAITEIAAVRTRGVLADWPGGRGGTERGRAQERSPGNPGNPGDCPPGGPAPRGIRGAARPPGGLLRQAHPQGIRHPGQSGPRHTAACRRSDRDH